jgi:hypothetical protein
VSDDASASAPPAQATTLAPAGALGVLVFALLVLYSFAAFFIAQRLKHIPTAVQDLRFDPAFYPEGGGVPRTEPISFEIERPDEVTVKILYPNGGTAATLASRRRLIAYTPLHLQWNGRRGMASAAGLPQGPPAPRGEYRVRVLLAKRRLEVRSPSSIELIRRRG